MIACSGLPDMIPATAWTPATIGARGVNDRIVLAMLKIGDWTIPVTAFLTPLNTPLTALLIPLKILPKKKLLPEPPNNLEGTNPPIDLPVNTPSGSHHAFLGLAVDWYWGNFEKSSVDLDPIPKAPSGTVSSGLLFLPEAKVEKPGENGFLNPCSRILWFGAISLGSISPPLYVYSVLNAVPLVLPLAVSLLVNSTALAVSFTPSL